mgnify:CR=1 FL=1
MAWSEAARRAAAEARRRRARPKPIYVPTRKARALASHKPATAHKQRLADESEKRVARMLGGERTGDNLPVDHVVKNKAGKVFGVEVKTLVDQRNDKLTMHPDALARKVRWGHANHASLYTVVVDLRGQTPQMLYRRGVGSFRLAGLTPVQDGAHLKQLMGV